MTIEKILIANRGEIAVRVIKTAKKLGIKTVAVYSESDSNSLAVNMADESYLIGPSPSNQSYLVIDNIIDVIERTGADAVHPGYGFLSENYEFASRLEEIGVKLIGPSKEAIKAMGDKITSKKIATEAKVNTVPGYVGTISNDDEAQKIADSIGFPVMVKAAAGGGGRGMRIVHDRKDVVNAFRSAEAEAKKSFGDGRIFIEKFIEKPRHIEVQVMADQHGNIVCLGERECSIQRYNQKVIEEAPSPFLTPEIRSEMYRQSASLAEKVGYYSVGTIEYIVDQSGNFYFLEMNTRLQVEHPVTELITGFDLVEQMINIANGQKLGIVQDDVKLKGWALESRIYAEDPSRGFLPSSGRVSRYHQPAESENIRVDAGVYEGDEISMFYDPMIAKVCSYGKTRDEAISHMQKALSQYAIEGVSHNISFLEDVMHSERFAKGDLSTNYIAEEYPDGYEVGEITSESLLPVFCAATVIRLRTSERLSSISGQIKNAEKEINTRWAICLKDEIHIVEIIEISNDNFEFLINGRKISFESHWREGSAVFFAKFDGEDIALRYRVKNNNYLFSSQGGEIELSVNTPRVAELMKYMPESSDESDNSILEAPISGKIIDFKVSVGDKVTKGSELFVIEAMKMENTILSDFETVIEEISVKVGDNVQANDIVLKFEKTGTE
ncbi:MAG: acetyl/propionyl/methylcrotonyl-CoA carboxylase subunit alpha [Rickettsiales bacterium]|nr:acetyl/propionyl/methylcrotonyl-CoA carboxylase subunit alpha [Rickettsiales bacterium]